MTIYILYIIMHVNSGTVVQTQEHITQAQCNYAKTVLLNQAKAVGETGISAAYCIAK